MAPLILNLGVRWKWSISSSDRFTPWKKTR